MIPYEVQSAELHQLCTKPISGKTHLTVPGPKAKCIWGD